MQGWRLGASGLALAASFLSGSGEAVAAEKLFETGWSTYTSVASMACVEPALSFEAADDFDVVGSIERVYVYGKNACSSCPPTAISLARVRFYAWTPNGPGQLQSEQVLSGTSPNLKYDFQDIEDIDFTLPQPFQATGKHYVSVRLEFVECFSWYYWIANKDNPIGGPAYQQSGANGWQQVTAFSMGSCDLSFALYGTSGTPPVPQGCGEWQVLPSPNDPAVSESNFNDIAYLGPNDIWAVGAAYGQFIPGHWNQHNFAAHFDGTQWTITPTPNPAPVPLLTQCELYAVEAIASDDVWAAGRRIAQDPGAGYVGTHNLVLHWDGSTWTQVNAPLPPSFGAQGVSGDTVYEILALSKNDVWFFGEWIDLDPQGFSSRYAMAMHWDGSSFTVHDVPAVGANGSTIYAADALGPNDIWAVGAAGDGDPAASKTHIFHWDGTSWTHFDAGPIQAIFHNLGGVQALAANDVWISGIAWTPPNVSTPFLLHWNGSSFEFIQVPFAGGHIVGQPPAMYVFGIGGVSIFDGVTFQDAHLLEGFESINGFGLGGVVQTGPCEMLGVGTQNVAGAQKTLFAKLEPRAWANLGHAKAGSAGVPKLLGAGPLTALSSNLLALQSAKPFSTSFLVVGASALNAVFSGGTLVPAPQVIVPLPADANGEITLPFTLPAGLPSTATLYFQYWISDPAATEGLAASNALGGKSP